MSRIIICVGFIDVTFRCMCWPSTNNSYSYSGYRKKHGIKLQIITVSDGIIFKEGPCIGNIHDAKIRIYNNFFLL